MELSRNVSVDDIHRIRAKLYITQDPGRDAKWSAYWVLLLLSAVIASAGVVGDSAATVIGAMIVAPLMTPIIGTALALVLAERRPLVDNLGLVMAGAVVVVAVGYLIGMTDPGLITAATNSQVAARVSPGLIDLLAALATGAVGAFALVRPDISDTLPGVAIAISLVPPLAVVGLTLESGAPSEAAGALLLFATNVAAIIATGTFTFILFHIRRILRRAGVPLGKVSNRTLWAVIGAVVLVAMPLTFGSITAGHEAIVVQRAKPVIDNWAAGYGWDVTSVAYRQGSIRVAAVGPPPSPRLDELRVMLDRVGLQREGAELILNIGNTRVLEPSVLPPAD